MLDREKIVRMARSVGLPEAIIEMTPEAFERFAFVIAAHENEECAKVCEAGVVQASDWDASYWNQACENRAAAIRARI